MHTPSFFMLRLDIVRNIDVSPDFRSSMRWIAFEPSQNRSEEKRKRVFTMLIKLDLHLIWSHTNLKFGSSVASLLDFLQMGEQSKISKIGRFFGWISEGWKNRKSLSDFDLINMDRLTNYPRLYPWKWPCLKTSISWEIASFPKVANTADWKREIFCTIFILFTRWYVSEKLFHSLGSHVPLLIFFISWVRRRTPYARIFP